MIQVLLISGKQGSGKTTLQKALIEKFKPQTGTRCHLINFADPLYEMHNFCVGKLEALGVKRDIVKDGPLLQLLGTEWGRKTVDENVWVDALYGQINLIMEREGRGYEKNVFIVGDCRFRNELMGLPNALRIRLECSRDTRKARCTAWRENDTHPSEVDLDEWVYEVGRFDLIFNTGTQATAHIATMIMAQLDKNVWLEKREYADAAEAGIV